MLELHEPPRTLEPQYLPHEILVGIADVLGNKEQETFNSYLSLNKQNFREVHDQFFIDKWSLRKAVTNFFNNPELPISKVLCNQKAIRILARNFPTLFKGPNGEFSRGLVGVALSRMHGHSYEPGQNYRTFLNYLITELIILEDPNAEEAIKQVDKAFMSSPALIINALLAPPINPDNPEHKKRIEKALEILDNNTHMDLLKVAARIVEYRPIVLTTIWNDLKKNDSQFGYSRAKKFATEVYKSKPEWLVGEGGLIEILNKKYSDPDISNDMKALNSEVKLYVGFLLKLSHLMDRTIDEIPSNYYITPETLKILESISHSEIDDSTKDKAKRFLRSQSPKSVEDIDLHLGGGIEHRFWYLMHINPTVIPDAVKELAQKSPASLRNFHRYSNWGVSIKARNVYVFFAAIHALKSDALSEYVDGILNFIQEENILQLIEIGDWNKGKFYAEFSTLNDEQLNKFFAHVVSRPSKSELLMLLTYYYFKLNKNQLITLTTITNPSVYEEGSVNRRLVEYFKTILVYYFQKNSGVYGPFFAKIIELEPELTPLFIDALVSSNRSDFFDLLLYLKEKYEISRPDIIERIKAKLALLNIRIDKDNAYGLLSFSAYEVPTSIGSADTPFKEIIEFDVATDNALTEFRIKLKALEKHLRLHIGNSINLTLEMITRLSQVCRSNLKNDVVKSTLLLEILSRYEPIQDNEKEIIFSFYEGLSRITEINKVIRNKAEVLAQNYRIKVRPNEFFIGHASPTIAAPVVEVPNG